MNLGLVLRGAALVGIGVGIGAHLAERRIHNPRDLEYIAYLVGEVVEAEQAIEECREAIPKVWDRAFHAGRHAAEFGLVVDEVGRLQRHNARWN